MDEVSFDNQKVDVSNVVQKCIKSIRLCLLDTENVINVGIKLIEHKNPNSADLSFLRNDYYAKIHRLSQQYSNISENSFHETIKDNLKELNEIYRNVGNKLVGIIKNNNVSELTKIMTNMPLLVTEMFSNLKDYARLSIDEIEAAKNTIKPKVEQVISFSTSQPSSNNIQSTNSFNSQSNNSSLQSSTPAPTRIVFNPSSTVSTGNNYSGSGFSLNDNREYYRELLLTEGLWSGFSTTILNAWNMLTLKSGSIDNTIKDVSDNIAALRDQSNKSFNSETAKNDPSAFLSMCKDFFTSDAFLTTAAGLITTVTIVLLLRKAYRKIRNWLVDTYHRTFD